MPGSMPEGKAFIKEFLLTKNIKRILDVGPGAGNYFKLLTGDGEYTNYPGGTIDAEWVAVEIWEPYVEFFHINNLYDRIIISDIYDLDWDEVGTFDVVILGDVLEHMEEGRGRQVIKQAANHATWVILSLPIVNFPQGESYGNIYETHVEQYTHERIVNLLKDYIMVDYYQGAIIGVYIFQAYHSVGRN